MSIYLSIYIYVYVYIYIPASMLCVDPLQHCSVAVNPNPPLSQCHPYTLTPNNPLF